MRASLPSNQASNDNRAQISLSSRITTGATALFAELSALANCRLSADGLTQTGRFGRQSVKGLTLLCKPNFRFASSKGIECAPIYVLLASQEFSFVTGEVYGVTGGHLLP